MSAIQLLDDAAVTMATSKSYRAVASIRIGAATNKVSLGFDAAGNYSGSINIFGFPTGDLVVVEPVGYIRGQEFWKAWFSIPSPDGSAPMTQAEIDSTLAIYGDHYVTIPASSLEVWLVLDLSRLRATALPDCMGVHGRLTIGGPTTFNGAQVYVVSDDGSEPGGRAARYFIAAVAPHRVLHMEWDFSRTAGQEPARGQCPGTGVFKPEKAIVNMVEKIDLSDFGSIGTVGAPTDVVSGGFTP